MHYEGLWIQTEIDQGSGINLIEILSLCFSLSQYLLFNFNEQILKIFSLYFHYLQSNAVSIRKKIDPPKKHQRPKSSKHGFLDSMNTALPVDYQYKVNTRLNFP